MTFELKVLQQTELTARERKSRLVYSVFFLLSCLL